MRRCPQCSTEYPEATQFCPRDGATVVVVDALLGRVIAGRYRLTAKLGQGGMGAVYRGEHIKMRRQTAIKILSPAIASSPEYVARFEREAALASTINHPNAVAIYDFGEAEDGLVYLAMELLDGESLSALLARQGRLPLDLVVRITRQAAEALDAAHRRGIVHRDFKPDNVMLCTDERGALVVKVVDFGIAKQTQSTDTGSALTQTGSVLGTPTYMSPEQVADRPLDARSDLYSLALTVYQMLSGALPFKGETLQNVMVMRLLEPPTPLRVQAPDVPPPVEAVVMKALAREPSQRQPSTVAMAAELEQAVAATSTYTTPQGVVLTPQQPIAVPTAATTPPQVYPVPPTLPEPLPGPPRRRAWIAATFAGAFVLLGVGSLGGYALYRYFVEPAPVVGPTIGPPPGRLPIDPRRNENVDPNQPPPRLGPTASELAAQSIELRRREQFDEAERVARSAVEADPTSAVAAAALADALLDLGRIADGGKMAAKAVELDGENAAAHRVLGAFYARDRDFTKAVTESKRALELGPSDEDAALARLTLGDVYLQQSRYDAAIEMYEQAAGYEAWPLVAMLGHLGIADAHAAQNKIDTAIEEGRRVAASPPDGPNAKALANMRYAKLLMYRQRHADAVQLCDAALATATLDDLRAASLVVQGFAYLYLQQPADALRVSERALDGGGEDKQLRGYAYSVKGVALVMLGRVTEGRDAIAQAKTILPDDPNVSALARQAGLGS